MTYKEAFQKTEEAKAFASFVHTKSFEAAMQAALLTLGENLRPTASDMQTSAANGFRLDGAYKLVTTLKNLVSLPTQTTRQDPDNLKQ